jgi:hypothetical protein
LEAVKERDGGECSKRINAKKRADEPGKTASARFLSAE